MVNDCTTVYETKWILTGNQYENYIDKSRYRIVESSLERQKAHPEKNKLRLLQQGSKGGSKLRR